MQTLTILIMLALAATVISMVVGVGSMGRGGKLDDKHSAQFMNAASSFRQLQWYC